MIKLHVIPIGLSIKNNCKNNLIQESIGIKGAAKGNSELRANKENE